MINELLNKIILYAKSPEKLLLISKQFHETTFKNKIIVNLKDFFNRTPRIAIIHNSDSFTEKALSQKNIQVLNWLRCNSLFNLNANTNINTTSILLLKNSNLKTFLWSHKYLKHETDYYVKIYFKLLSHNVEVTDYCFKNKLVHLDESDWVRECEFENIITAEYIDKTINVSPKTIMEYIRSYTLINRDSKFKTKALMYAYNLYFKKTDQYPDLDIDLTILSVASYETIKWYIETFPNTYWDNFFIDSILRRNFFDLVKEIFARKTNDYNFEKVKMFTKVASYKYTNTETLTFIYNLNKDIYQNNATSIFENLLLENLERAKWLYSFGYVIVSKNHYQIYNTVVTKKQFEAVKYIYEIDPKGTENLIDLSIESHLHSSNDEYFNIASELLKIKPTVSICVRKIVAGITYYKSIMDAQSQTLKIYDWINQKKSEGYTIEII